MSYDLSERYVFIIILLFARGIPPQQSGIGSIVLFRSRAIAAVDGSVTTLLICVSVESMNNSRIYRVVVVMGGPVGVRGGWVSGVVYPT